MNEIMERMMDTAAATSKLGEKGMKKSIITDGMWVNVMVLTVPIILDSLAPKRNDAAEARLETETKSPRVLRLVWNLR